MENRYDILEEVCGTHVQLYLFLHFLLQNPSKDSLISTSLPSPCFFTSLKNNKMNFFMLPISYLMCIDQGNFGRVLVCIYCESLSIFDKPKLFVLSPYKYGTSHRQIQASQDDSKHIQWNYIYYHLSFKSFG